MASRAEGSPRRFVVGIGVATYDDPDLNLKAVPTDVKTVTDWFAEQSGIVHEKALLELANSPTVSEIQAALADWLEAREPNDVVVVYVAAHGEVDGGTAYVLGRDSPRHNLAGRALAGDMLGAIIGQSPPHNVLFIVDACVAGRLGMSIQRKAEDVALEKNTRDPHQRWSHAVVCSTFDRDPALDGRFARAFVNVVSQERWTGTVRPFLDIDALITGLNQELKDVGAAQVAERRVWGTGAAEVIPNPNFASRRLGALFADEEFASHFDPSSRGAARGEPGWYFTGRSRELTTIVRWLASPARGAASNLFVVTGSPGSGKSALVSRLVVLSDPRLRSRIPSFKRLSKRTVPAESSIAAVAWCHNKTVEQVAGDIAGRLGLMAKTTGELRAALSGAATALSPVRIVIDSLDEAVEGHASRIVTDLIEPLVALDHVKVLVATRRRAVHGKQGGESSETLLQQLGVAPGDSNCLDLDDAVDRTSDMHAYVMARLTRSGEAGSPTPYANDVPAADRLATRIVEASGTSFLVAAVTARSFAARDSVVEVTEGLELPTEAGAALAGYIARLADPGVVTDVLRPLAWAGGAGLPWATLWSPLANALAVVANGGRAPVYDDRTIAAVLDRAGDLVVESTDGDETVYRLFHEALAETLRRDLAPEVAHAAIGRQLDAIVRTSPYESASAYALKWLSSQLAQSPTGYDRLYELVTDPDWERAKRARFGTSQSFMSDLWQALDSDLAQRALDLPSIAGVCLVKSRLAAVAPAPVIDVIARAGELERARLMAHNLAFALERCWAFSFLAPTFAAEADLAAARDCLAQGERAIPAINATHAGMAWSWLTSAAVACGFRDDATRFARSAAAVLDSLTDDEDWEAPNVLFWAGMAARAAGDEVTRDSLRSRFEERISAPRRNQELQAAAVLGLTQPLRDLQTRWAAGERGGIVRDGNLAFALGDAGLVEELSTVLEIIQAEGPARRGGEDDAEKHLAWAFGLARRFDSAIAHLGTVENPEHRARGLRRLIAMPGFLEDPEAVATARAMAGGLTSGNARVRTLLVPVLYDLGDSARALRLADDLVRMGIEASSATTVAFPEPETPEPEPLNEPLSARAKRKVLGPGKTARRHLRTRIGALDDEALAAQAIALAKAGKRSEAEAVVENVVVTRFRWLARHIIANEMSPDDPDFDRLWASALIAAGHLNDAATRRTAGAIAGALERQPRRAETHQRLLLEVERVSKRWLESSFDQEYELLRQTLGPGHDRTGRLEALLTATRETLNRFASNGWLDRSPVRSLESEVAPDRFQPDPGGDPRGYLLDPAPQRVILWTAAEVETLVASGSAGKRVLSLVLMGSSVAPLLVDPVLQIIGGSLSAFEQYHALVVAMKGVPDLNADDRDRLRAVLSKERGRYITPGSDRYSLSLAIERSLDVAGATADRGTPNVG